MKHVYVRYALAGAALAMVASSLPAQEYGWLTPALETTIAQALPPYQPLDQAQYDDLMSKSMAAQDASKNSGRVEETSPPAAAESTPH